MPRDAAGNVIPGSYNPDGSVNQAVMSRFRARNPTPLANPGAAMRNPAATAALTRPRPLAPNPSPNAAAILQQQAAMRAQAVDRGTPPTVPNVGPKPTPALPAVPRNTATANLLAARQRLT